MFPFTEERKDDDSRTFCLYVRRRHGSDHDFGKMVVLN